MEKTIEELKSENARLRQAYDYIHSSRNNVDDELNKCEKLNAELLAALEQAIEDSFWDGRVKHPTVERIKELISKHKAQ